MSVKLLIKDGENSHNFKLNPEPIQIGRSSSSQIKLNDPMVSGKHCTVYIDNGIATIQDLGTTNGTFVDGQKIVNAKINLNTIIKIGNVEITVDSSEMTEQEKSDHLDES